MCPYFAMFPADFVRRHVLLYSKKNDWIFDPFCGRGTTILESLSLGRNAAGSDINPVAYCVSRAKAEHPSLSSVLIRIMELENQYKKYDTANNVKCKQGLPAFFKRAFYHSTLDELLFLRDALNWKNQSIDRFITALVIGSLHGEMKDSKAYFSNQMPRTICLKPNYSLRYWKKHGLFPKKRRIFVMLRDKAIYRLQTINNFSEGNVKLADARKVSTAFPDLSQKISLIITSPPYLNVTCYEEDQWLRLWFLGQEPYPTYGTISKDDRHLSETKYWQFLTESWQGISPLVSDSAKMVIRLGAKQISRKDLAQQLVSTINDAFPTSRLISLPTLSTIKNPQTQNFLPHVKGCKYELDFVFSLN